MRCPVWKLAHIMPYDELIAWAYRYEFGMFGKKLDDHRAAIIAKCAAEAFSDGKKDIPLSNYMVKFEQRDQAEEKTSKRNLLIASTIFPGILPTEVLKNGNSSKPDSTTET